MSRYQEEIENLETLCGLMRQHGVRTLLFKRLSPNDNSKNQIYLGGSYRALQLIPFGEVHADKSRKDSKRDRFKARLSLYWLDRNEAVYPAPDAQLILYPKYPEVRMSGFLKGAEVSPSQHLMTRNPGRILFVGVTGDRRLIGHVVGAENPVVRALERYSAEQGGDLLVTLFNDGAGIETKDELLRHLASIHRSGWIDSFRLDRNGNPKAYTAQNGGGYTLEGMLGVVPNGLNEPDFLGWEIKQHSVPRLDDPMSGGPITLMTPEPDTGIYTDAGVISFVRKFGYPDVSGKPDRLNFGGVHRTGVIHPRTGLKLVVEGFDPDSGKVTDVEGGIFLLSGEHGIAAGWTFRKVIEVWNRKHSRTAYVPSEKRKEPGKTIQYRYGSRVALGEGTDFGKFLKSLTGNIVYYDPAIKIEHNSSPRPTTKRRSQFRIGSREIGSLYDTMQVVDLTGY